MSERSVAEDIEYAAFIAGFYAATADDPMMLRHADGRPYMNAMSRAGHGLSYDLPPTESQKAENAFKWWMANR